MCYGFKKRLHASVFTKCFYTSAHNFILCCAQVLRKNFQSTWWYTSKILLSNLHQLHSDQLPTIKLTYLSCFTSVALLLENINVINYKMFYFGFRLAKASLILLLTLGFQNMSSQGENFWWGHYNYRCYDALQAKAGHTVFMSLYR